MGEFKEDEIFLLSKEEYEKYQALIPVMGNYWWLRSPAYTSFAAECATPFGGVYDFGRDVFFSSSVRPGLRITDRESLNLKPKDQFIKYKNTWIYLGDNLAISKDEIAKHKFDDIDNDDGSSEIRIFLLEWRRKRKKG